MKASPISILEDPPVEHNGTEKTPEINPTKSYESEHEDESFVNILEDSKSSPSGGPVSVPED